jgi:phenylalanyl-tRNA synthetase beta chain
MRAVLSWLQEFAPIGDDVAAIADALNTLGMAVDDVIVTGEPINGVVVARVLQLRAHPRADRIQLVDVDAGDGQPLQIACGAFNMHVGDLVPLATIGTVMPNGMEIARRQMRGEWSNGMLCSPIELLLGDEAGGIYVLPGDPRWRAVVRRVWHPRRSCSTSTHAQPARRLFARRHRPRSRRPPRRGVHPTVDAARHIGRSSVGAGHHRRRDRCGRFTAAVISGVRIARRPTGWRGG